MRKIEFWVSDKNINKGEYFSKYSTNLTSFNAKDNKYFFHSQYNSTYEIKHVKMYILDFKNKEEDWKEWSKVFLKIYKQSIIEARKLTKEPVGHICKDVDPISSFSSVIHKWIYKEDSSDIFEFFGDMWISVLEKHILTNGNKRTSIVFLRALIESFGYYLKWTGGLFENYKMHEEIVEKYVVGLRSFNSNREESKKEIYNWIKQNSYISKGEWI